MLCYVPVTYLTCISFLVFSVPHSHTLAHTHKLTAHVQTKYNKLYMSLQLRRSERQPELFVPFVYLFCDPHKTACLYIDATLLTMRWCVVICPQMTSLQISCDDALAQPIVRFYTMTPCQLLCHRHFIQQIPPRPTAAVFTQRWRRFSLAFCSCSCCSGRLFPGQLQSITPLVRDCASPLFVKEGICKSFPKYENLNE